MSGVGYGSSFISAPACSSQDVMPISRYIVVAVVRCSWANSRLPRTAIELAEAEMAMRNDRAHLEFNGEGHRRWIRLLDVAGAIARLEAEFPTKTAGRDSNCKTLLTRQ